MQQRVGFVRYGGGVPPFCHAGYSLSYFCVFAVFAFLNYKFPPEVSSLGARNFYQQFFYVCTDFPHSSIFFAIQR